MGHVIRLSRVSPIFPGRRLGTRQDEVYNISESVNLCRDGADKQYMQYESDFLVFDHMTTDQHRKLYRQSIQKLSGIMHY